ncbi:MULTISPECIES: elongation factor P [Marinilabiliaceae]|uniref:Elongation factor P n=2 Tax=Marinilabiliaceae TaxID=558415 RepID=A0A1T5HTH4_9BACT|nr:MULTISPECIES: elongation factor P [Marinilabiliaceae]ASB49177.1 elongation factor P [Alkalitalea saponilacus]TCO08425.1 elongation factor P [Natronoflexus pectinivorans]SKC23999.1 elongation factor P [Alkalitalea saponilacus]
MATTADFRNGMCIEHNGQLFSIVQFQHVKPGKGPAFVRTKLKNISTGRVLENTFSAGVKVTEARVEHRPHQFLYKDDMGYHFMNTESFEQMTIQEALVESPDLMREGQEVDLVYHVDSETPLMVNLPQFIVYEITYTEPGVRGDTSSTSSLKQATIDTGATVMVPLFIENGERIKVDTKERSYVERAKE